MVEGYGEEARALYVRISLSLDALLPLLAANLLTSFSLFLTRALQCLEKWRKPLFALGIATCASDWMENLMMILLLRTYPQQHMALAVMGRLMTSVKYLLTASFAVAILREAYLIRKKRPTVA